MSKQTVSNEYVSAFCLEMSLLLHAGIGNEDGLYLLIEDEKDKKRQKNAGAVSGFGDGR